MNKQKDPNTEESNQWQSCCEKMLVPANRNVALHNKNEMENVMEFAVLHCFATVCQHHGQTTWTSASSISDFNDPDYVVFKN